MQLRDALLGISNDARAWLKTWAQDFTGAEASQSAGSAVNPLLWHLGHLACTEDEIYQLFSGQPGITDKELLATCGTGCPTPSADTRYPSLAELWALVDRTHSRLIGLLEGASDGDFDRPPSRENRFFRSLGQAIYEGALHENYHVGVIATLRKALAKKPIT